MVSLYRDPTGKNVFSKTNPTDDYLSDSSKQYQVENKMFEVRYANFVLHC